MASGDFLPFLIAQISVEANAPLHPLRSRPGFYISALLTMRSRVPRRGGRVVDRTALEMRSTRKGTGGSNPSLSAIFTIKLLN